MEIDVDGYKYYLHYDLWLKQQEWGKELERRFWNRVFPFLPTSDWEIKPYREYKGKGLLEQMVSGGGLIGVEKDAEISRLSSKYTCHNYPVSP